MPEEGGEYIYLECDPFLLHGSAKYTFDDEYIASVLEESDDISFDTMTSGAFYPSSTTLSVYASATSWNKSQIVFGNLSIPQGALINRAYLELFPSTTGSTPQTVYINVADYDDISAPTTWGEAASYSYLDSVTWVLSSYFSKVPVESGNITDQIQTILNKPSWESGNSILIELGPDSIVTPQLNFYSSDYGDGEFAPKLYIDYDASTQIISASPFEMSASIEADYLSSIVPCSVDPLSATASLSCFAIIAYTSVHHQTFSEPLIIVTTEPPYGSISLSDAVDAFSIEVGAQIALEDAADTFSITAAFGSFGTIALTDVEDIFTSLPGGDVTLSDALDSFSSTGAAEAIATAGLSDSLDTLEIEALSGTLAECSIVDAADLLTITGSPETTGGVNLVDASDLFSIQGMGGIASSGIALLDALDGLSMTGAPEETGVIALLDAADIFSISGGKLTRFSTHIIQYQKTRY